MLHATDIPSEKAAIEEGIPTPYRSLFKSGGAENFYFIFSNGKTNLPTYVAPILFLPNRFPHYCSGSFFCVILPALTIPHSCLAKSSFFRQRPKSKLFNPKQKKQKTSSIVVLLYFHIINVLCLNWFLRPSFRCGIVMFDGCMLFIYLNQGWIREANDDHSALKKNKGHREKKEAMDTARAEEDVQG